MPWRLLTRLGHVVRFATEHGGTAPAADQRLARRRDLRAARRGRRTKAFYAEMQSDEEFRAPLAWADVKPDEFDGLILPGGHAPGMRQYLGSELLRRKVAEYWALGRPVGAICHGVLVLARTRDPTTGRSLLYGRRTTCLPKYMERSAFLTTAWRLGRYYRTYPAYVEDEVRAALRDPADFVRGPRVLSKRGTETDDGGLRRRGRQLRLGALARRRLPVRQAVRGPTRSLTFRLQTGSVHAMGLNAPRRPRSRCTWPSRANTTSTSSPAS